MKKDVIITVKGTQVNEFGETDTQELISKGTYHIKDGAYYIIYNESQVTGMEGTATSLKAEPGRVTLNRMGTSQHRQVFEPGVRHRGNYVTPFGIMYMAATSTKVEVNLTDSGGTINLEYVLEVENQKVSDNVLSLTIREA